MSRASDSMDRILQAIDENLDGLKESEQDEVLDWLLDFLECYRATDAADGDQAKLDFDEEFPVLDPADRAIPFSLN